VITEDDLPPGNPLIEDFQELRTRITSRGTVSATLADIGDDEPIPNQVGICR